MHDLYKSHGNKLLLALTWVQQNLPKQCRPQQLSSFNRGTPSVTFLAPTPAKWKVFCEHAEVSKEAATVSITASHELPWLSHRIKLQYNTARQPQERHITIINNPGWHVDVDQRGEKDGL